MSPGRDPEDDDLTQDDPLFDDAPGPGATPGSVRAGVSEFVRKLALTGLGAVFMTEEGIRNLAGQLKLPKEVLGYILSQADKTKQDVTRTVTEEVRRFLQSEKLRAEFLKLMQGMTVEVKAQIRLVPDPEARHQSPKLVVSDLDAKVGSQQPPAAPAPAPHKPRGGGARRKKE